MSDANETNPNREPEKQQHQQDKAGDILRKERITKRITVETIAKDLKLNVNYIKALEDNKYDELPADPYVRVYLRSIASYLMLDPDDILRRFYRDRGIDPNEEKEESEKIQISMTEKEKPSLAWVFVLLAIAVLTGLTYFANRLGWITMTSQEGRAVTDTSAAAELTEEEIQEEEMIDTAVSDTLPQVAPDTADTAAEETAAAGERGGVDERDSLQLVVSAVRDSVWVQVFSDGESWRNFIDAGETRVFAASDSFNVRVGNNSRLRYSLNGEPLTVRGGGVVAFKVDHDGADTWNLSRWNSVFKDRM
jgi:cytoskeletal protein RodZ